MKLDLLIFDLDGTLVDSQYDLTDAVNKMRADYGGKPLEAAQVRSFLGSGVNALIKNVLPAGVEDTEKAVLKFKEYYSEILLDKTKPYDKIPEALHSLRDIQKAVLSNKSEAFCKVILNGLGLSKYFGQIWGSDTIAIRKPDPKTIIELAKLFNADLKKTIMIGDSENDFRAAKASGAKSLAVLYGYGGIDVVNKFKPDYIAKTPQEIVEIIKEVQDDN